VYPSAISPVWSMSAIVSNLSTSLSSTLIKDVKEKHKLRTEKNVKNIFEIH